MSASPTSRRGPSSRPITPHQLEALQLAATGHTHKQIATQLGIDFKSVGKLMTEIFRKLGARSMPHAVLLACRAGILDGRPQRHGDHAGFAAHVYRGEEPCDACKAGESAYRAERRRKRRQTATDSPRGAPEPARGARDVRKPAGPSQRRTGPRGEAAA